MLLNKRPTTPPAGPRKFMLRKPAATNSTTAPAPPPATDVEQSPDLPTFQELDEREALFVVEYVARSGTRGAGADAALAAGYSNGNRDAAHSMASRLLRRPAVLRAIKGETGRRIAAAAPLGVAVLESLAQSARSEQVRLAAANSLVDRGHGPVISRNANSNLNVNTNLEDLLEKLDRQERAPRQPPTIDMTPRRTSYDEDSETE